MIYVSYAHVSEGSSLLPIREAPYKEVGWGMIDYVLVAARI